MKKIGIDFYGNDSKKNGKRRGVDLFKIDGKWLERKINFDFAVLFRGMMLITSIAGAIVRGTILQFLGDGGQTC